MPTWIIGLLTQYRYAIIVPIAIVEGPIISLIAGFVVRFGPLDFIPTYFALMAGDLIGDVLWYWIGRRWGEVFVTRFGRYVSITKDNIDVTKKMFERHHSKILIASKLTTGFGLAPAILFTAGMSRVSFARYMSINIFGQFVWTAILVAVGYFFGNFYAQINNNFQRIEVIALVVVLFLCLWGFGKYLRARALREYSK
jgi:membrane-associated protein